MVDHVLYPSFSFIGVTLILRSHTSDCGKRVPFGDLELRLDVLPGRDWKEFKESEGDTFPTMVFVPTRDRGTKTEKETKLI